MGLILLRWSLTLPRTPPPTPVLYSAGTNPLPVAFLGYVHTQNTSTQPVTPKHPTPGLNLKVGKMNYSLGKMDPNWVKWLKSVQNFSGVGRKNSFIPPVQPAPPTS